MSKANALQPGLEIADGRYVLAEKLGEGGFGQVWKGWDRQDEVWVAIKTLLPDLADAAGAARFSREIATASRLDHPHIVRILDVGVLPVGWPFFAMEFLSGHPIEAYAHNLPALLQIFDQLLDALAYAHARGVIHRDLKPDNLLIIQTPGGPVAKLLDFGIARLDDGLGGPVGRSMSITRPGQPVGTVPYMSPEQASGDPSSVGPASDLYSVGVMLYEQCCGRRPFEGDWMFVLVQHVSQQPPDPVFRPDLSIADPGPLRELILTLMSKPFMERPECAAHVRQSLSFVGQRLGLPAPSMVVPQALTPAAAPATDMTMTMASEVADLSVGQASVPLNSLSLLRIHEPPLLGRQAEQALLWELAGEVMQSRRTHAAVIHGPADLGKTRLARWLSEEVHRTGQMRVLRIYIAEGGLTAAMRAAIYRHVRAPRLERRPLRARLDEALGLAPEDLDALCDFLLAGGSTREEVSDEERQSRMRLWQKVIWQLTEHPSRRPLLVWIDGTLDQDPQETTTWVELLLSVARMMRRPVMLLWSLDTESSELPERLHRIAGRDEVTLLPLQPLTSQAQEMLARHYAPELAPETIDFIQDCSMGSPRFLREMILDLLGEGKLKKSQDGLVLDAQAGLQVQGGLAGVMIQRLEFFLERHTGGRAAREAVVALAFLGQSFPESLAQRVLHQGHITVAELIQEGFIETRPGAREEELVLASQVLRHVLQEEAARLELRRTLEQQAVELRMDAGLLSMIAGDWELAERNLEVAWALVDDLESSRGIEGLQLGILDLMACVAWRRRETAVLRGRSRELDALVAQVPEGHREFAEALAGLWQASLAVLDEDYPLAVRCVSAAYATASEAGLDELMARALRIQAQIDRLTGGRERALETLTKSVQLFRKLNAVTRETRPLMSLLEADAVSDQAAIMAELGQNEAAFIQWNMLLKLYRHHGDRQGAALTLISMGRLLRKMGRSSDAAHHVSQARELLQLLDDRRGLALLKWEEASGAMEIDLEQADLNYRTAERLFSTIGDTTSAAMCANARGEIARKRGDLQEAIKHYSVFAEVMRRVGHVHGHGMAEVNIGWTFMAASDPTSARSHFHTAYTVLDEGGGPRDLQLSAMVGWSLASGRMGKVDPATVTIQNVAALTDEVPLDDEDTLKALNELDALAAQQGWAGLQAAIATIKRVG